MFALQPTGTPVSTADGHIDDGGLLDQVPELSDAEIPGHQHSSTPASRNCGRRWHAGTVTISHTPSSRSPHEVLHDHLSLAAAGDWQTDLERNFDEDIVVLTGFGVFTGRDQVRILAELLNAQLPGASFDYTTVLVHAEMAFLEWTARGPTARVRDGADSFLIRDGRIVSQTIHYTVENLTDDT